MSKNKPPLLFPISLDTLLPVDIEDCWLYKEVISAQNEEMRLANWPKKNWKREKKRHVKKLTIQDKQEV